ncbi:hypothetical protein TNCV_3104841 [Trichonephila clavipes]|nr:hypothetical protein TNCV_3104841 [Trichonephila clavipes]
MIIRHEKRSLFEPSTTGPIRVGQRCASSSSVGYITVPVWLRCSRQNEIPKYKFRIGRAQVPPSGEETGRQNYLR